MWPFSSRKDQGAVSPSTPAPSSPENGPTLLAPTKEMDQRYRRDIWLAREKDRLATLGFIALLMIEIVFAAIGAFVFIDYYIIRYPTERALLTAFVSSDSLRTAVQGQAPNAIDVDTAQVFVAGPGRYDAMAMVKNKNSQWVADVVYTWQWDGGKSEEQRTRLLSGEARPLLLFGVEGSRPRGMSVQVSRVDWWRVNPQAVRDPVAWVRGHVNMVANDVVHDDQFKIGEKVVGRTAFTLTNETGYGYREALVLLVAQKGNASVGVHQFTVSNLAPHESRNIQVDWFGTTPSANKVAIFPVIDVFDPSVYTPLSTDPGIDRRDMLQRRR